MPKQRRSKRVALGTELVAGQEVPYEVYEEYRRNTRYSLTPRRAILRLPHRLDDAAKRQEFERFSVWLQEAAQRRPDLVASHQNNEFRDGQTWTLGSWQARLNITRKDRQRAVGKRLPTLDDTTPELIQISLPETMSDTEASKSIERLLYRLTAKRATPFVEAMLDEVNDRHFRVDVGRIKLSATTSRWGSCSSKGNINLSTRLLGAPAACIRAVITHELAHRIEMNHSARFWKLVHDAMPSYDEAHQWLRDNGASLGWTQVEVAH